MSPSLRPVGVSAAWSLPRPAHNRQAVTGVCSRQTYVLLAQPPATPPPPALHTGCECACGGIKPTRGHRVSPSLRPVGVSAAWSLPRPAHNRQAVTGVCSRQTYVLLAQPPATPPPPALHTGCECACGGIKPTRGHRVSPSLRPVGVSAAWSLPRPAHNRQAVRHAGGCEGSTPTLHSGGGGAGAACTHTQVGAVPVKLLWISWVDQL